MCSDNNKARWGYCANIPSQDCQEDDSNDADGVIGVGLEGQVRFLTEILDDFRRFVDEIWRF